MATMGDHGVRHHGGPGFAIDYDSESNVAFSRAARRGYRFGRLSG
jgi:hypothetical protein